MRPTINQVITSASEHIGKQFHLPKEKNKGVAGFLLENLTGIPTSSACLDCEDGEVKTYPLKVLSKNGKFGKKGDLVADETVAITMMKPENFESETWETSRISKKIANVLFVGYIREGDNIIFKKLQLLQSDNEKHNELYKTFESDYNDIKKIWLEEKTITGKTGKLIQSRTKGAGGDAPKTRAFYFRKETMNRIDSI